ncbi:MAG: DNA polymerase III subunit alpha [Gammaproteobacteria bacterium]
MSQNFIHLHVHTEYSLIDSVVRLNPLVEGAANANMFAIAVTDHCNLFAVVKFYQAAIKRGIKPIFGCDVFLANEHNDASPFRLTLLCCNFEGYLALTRLLSQAYTSEEKYTIPLIKKEWLTGHSDGLIALSGGIHGDIGQALLHNKKSQAKALAQDWLQYFPQRFYLELTRTGREQEQKYIQSAIALARQMNIPVVATNDVCFLQAQDYDSHEVRVCIHAGYTLNDGRRIKNHSEQQYLRSSEEMSALFHDIPSAIENSVEIAKRCNVQLPLGDPHLPNFPLLPGVTVADQLAQDAQQGLERRLGESFAEIEQSYKTHSGRLQQELNVINRMGYAGYFLIVADFIHWAKANGVPVGPGRGSGAGSLVSYALGITDLDPLQYELLFERFLNPERVSMPDFDIDFCIEGRDRVIEYVTEKYGADCVAQIITFGTMAARAVLRDVGRVLAHPYGFVDKLAKLVPFEVGMTLEKALDQEEDLRERYQREEEVKILIDLAKKLEGLARNVGKHAGGVVIAPSLLTDFTALYRETGSEGLITQFDKDDIETVGLVKFDFLGLRNLTTIHAALETINQYRQSEDLPPILIEKIPLDDTETFKLLKKCHVAAVFQLESRGMRDLVKRLQPDHFEEIIALVALFRPGPLQSGMVDDFIARKHGHEKVVYLHPQLEPILKSTYGVILYQEQVMQIAQVLAGYSLGEADLLRRAMGKKKPEEMAQQAEIFTQGAVAGGIDEEISQKIFELMEKFAGYGFNKSHSAAYALITYQTAWLKAHYPSAFMAAVLSSDLDNTDRVVTMINECRSLQIKVLPPDVNAGKYKFKVNDDQTITYGLGAIKGIGEAIINVLVAEREQDGTFKSLYDLCRRIDAHKLNRRVLTALIKAGALDVWGEQRAVLSASVEKALQVADQYWSNQQSGQSDLFMQSASTNTVSDFAYIQAKAWTDLQRLQAEKESLGWYVSGHPLDYHRKELNHFISGKIAQQNLNITQSVTVAGCIVAIRSLYNKRGERMAFVILDDGDGRMELTVFSDCYHAHKELLAVDQIVIAEIDISIDGVSGNSRITAQRLLSLAQARASYGRHLQIKLSVQQTTTELLNQIAHCLTNYRGTGSAVCINYQHEDASTLLQLANSWHVDVDDELLQALVDLVGDEQVAMAY